MVAATITSSCRLLPVIAAALLTACATRPQAPEESEAPPALPVAFSDSGQQAVSDTWWQVFDDPQLDRLVNQALDGNLSLRAGYQRLRQARAAADRQGASLFPSLDANASAERRESNTAETTTFSTGLSASYEVDLWGRVQSLTEAEELRASATLADYQAAAISLSGEIASTWFQLLEQRAQYDLAQRQLGTNRDVLSVIEARFGRGLSNSADVLRQRQLVSRSVERMNDITGEIGLLEHQLAVLLGQPPGRSKLPGGDDLPALPVLPDTGVPAELIQRRPDLRQAWQLIQAADRDLAAAISNRFPRFSIEASVSSEASDASDLFENWLATLAGNLLVPLVDGGERRAEVRRSRAVREELVQEYGQAVLTAIQEVEDALTRGQQQRQRLDSLEERLGLADATYRQLRNRYLNGAASYVEVLDALRDQQDLQRTLLTTRQQLLSSRVALYRALAGSIENPGEHDAKQDTSTENDQA
jgi:NodT family efflux transporter outer membrane factor (OMF) lipoprotein